MFKKPSAIGPKCTTHSTLFRGGPLHWTRIEHSYA